MDIYDFWVIILIGLLIFIFYEIIKPLYITLKKRIKSFYFQYEVLSVSRPHLGVYIVTYKDEYNKIHIDLIRLGWATSEVEHNIFIGEENKIIIKKDKGDKKTYKILTLTKENF